MNKGWFCAVKLGMKLYSLIENHHRLEKAEVEIQMLPGIPQIHFLGLPDKAIKESFFRIKSAFKNCDYKFPQAQQIIVNIKPNYLKKSSKGVELAVALAILHLTGQKILSSDFYDSVIYGELSLDGGVVEPYDLDQYSKLHPEEKILTGYPSLSKSMAQNRLFKLNEEVFTLMTSDQSCQLIRPPQGIDLKYTNEEAELLFLVSVTGLHLLMAGPAGSGKSTLAKNAISFKDPITSSYKWPVLVAPHSSVTPAAFLGGGAQLYEGEIERADQGILFLDEFLEFDREIIETLRGPMTGEKLRLSRSGSTREYDCRIQVMATTNFCPCGKWTPDIKYRNCRFSVRKCHSYLEKLSGPILDRFGLLYFYKNKKEPRHVSGQDILNRIQLYQSRFHPEELETDAVDALISKFYNDLPTRRESSLRRVSRVYAIERESSKIELEDLLKAEKWTYRSFLSLEGGIS